MTAATGPERIAEAFARARADGRAAALMPYLMGGYPDVATSLAIGEAYVDAGADLIELGVPFSDPLADGPVIHAAGTAALAGGATVPAVLEVARALSARVPVVLMCYVNPIGARGRRRFVSELAAAGVSGLIVPDLPHEESDELRAACSAAGVALVPLVAPTTPAERLSRIGATATGFVYAVAVTGTTGERRDGETAMADVIGRVAGACDLPVALGFGISTPAQAAAAAAAGADGVIVGTRLVRAAGEGPDPVAAVSGLVVELAAALSTS